jgi:hypothetical protein
MRKVGTITGGKEAEGVVVVGEVVVRPLLVDEGGVRVEVHEGGADIRGEEVWESVTGEMAITERGWSLNSCIY